MHAPLTDADLRATWQRLHMTGDFDASMRNRAVRRAVEGAARTFQAREQERNQRQFDAKRRATNDFDY
jgi:hypothetical protein